MKKKIDVFEHVGEILNGVKNGVLITGKAEEQPEHEVFIQ